MVSIGSVIHLPASGTRLSAVVFPRRLSDENNKKKKNQTRNLRSISLSIKMDHAIMATSASPSPLILTSGASGRVNALFSLRALRGFLLVLHGFLFLLLSPFQRRVTRRASSVSMEKPRDEKQMESSSGGSRAPVVLRVPAAMVPRRAGRDQEVLARRAMAIRRLAAEDGEEKEPGRCERRFSLFVTSRGDTLFTQSWSPVTAPAKGLVVLLHGLNEHSGRYNHFAKQLTDKGFKVYGMDWIGHGGSDGLHGYVHSLDYAVNDLKAFLKKVLAENSGLPCFCFGHSTGGAIVLKVVLDPQIEALVEGVVLTSPAVGVQPSHPIFGVLAPIFSLLVPKYQFSAANKKGLPVSRDPEALIAKYSDPLVFTGSIRARTGSEILRISSYLQRNLSKVKVPFLVLHGTADTTTDPEASQKLYEEASSTDKSVKLYEGFLHDLLFEPERKDIEKDIVDWFSFRLENLNGAQRSG